MKSTNTPKYRDKKMEEVLRELASKFLLVESGTQSLITITHVKVSGDLKHATIYFTSYPAESEQFALDFTKRKRSEFKQYVKDNSRLARIPMIDFEIDLGEKNRQLIDEISRKS